MAMVLTVAIGNHLASRVPQPNVRAQTRPGIETPAPLGLSLAGDTADIAATVTAYMANMILDLYGCIINRKTFDIIRNECFNSQTFMLLRTITRIPRGWVIQISDGPALEYRFWVDNIGFICFAEGAPECVGHWLLIHADLRRERMYCYDALHDPSSVVSQKHHNMQANVVGMLDKANWRSSKLASGPMVAKRSITQA